jgi:hypothetical protein
VILSLISAVLAQAVEPPPSRYLDEAEIRAGLLSGDWQSCLTAGVADLTASVSLRIMPSGGVEVQTLSAPEPIASCWAARLSALQFREHDEEPLIVLWTLGIRDGVAVPYPAFQLQQRQLHPFFLFIPPDADPGVVEEMRRVLEVPR